MNNQKLKSRILKIKEGTVITWKVFVDVFPKYNNEEGEKLFFKVWNLRGTDEDMTTNLEELNEELNKVKINLK